MAGELQGLDSSLAMAGYALIDAAARAGLRPEVTSTIRTIAKQQTLWRRYLEGLSALPAAPPGRSAHNYGWAFDLVVTPTYMLEPVGRLWESWGGTWGGAQDPVHFELPGASAWLRSASDEEISALGL